MAVMFECLRNLDLLISNSIFFCLTGFEAVKAAAQLDFLDSWFGPLEAKIYFC